METILECCAALDVHKETVEACVRRLDANRKLHKQVRQFGTMTHDLNTLRDWLKAEAVTHVAMESTGVFWKPIWNILEGHYTLLLVNARHVKHVPGRKTDVKDSEWLAQLLQHGLLKGSFVPPRWQRQLRDLTRQRAQLKAECARVANRIHKTLEDANIKLSTVVTDILGASGRDILQALIAGETQTAIMAELARRRLRGKIPQLQLALEGHLHDHHRFMLRLLWDHLQQLERLIAELNLRIDDLTRPYAEVISRLDEIDGIDRIVAQVIIAEIGPEVTSFPSAEHLASWAGMCPGNNESAGKRKSGKTTKGSRWLRQALVQAGWAASHAKGAYLAAQYRRLAPRRGKKRALVAIGHSILVAIYHMLDKHTRYHDLGANYFDQRDTKRLTGYFVKRLEQLGHKVTLASVA